MTSLKPVSILGVCVFLAATLSAHAGDRASSACATGACASDAQITSQVRAALAQHPPVAGAGRVYAHTVGGVVYLTGHVLTDAERNTAESAVRHVTCVGRVVDNVNVREESGT
jgi:osmotically-inducible protein OsmY